MKGFASWLLPAVVALGYLFLLSPLAVLVVYAFNAGRSTVQWRGFSLEWFHQLLLDQALQHSLQVSALVALCSALLSTAIGTSAALAVVKHRFPGKSLFSTLIVAPLILPEIVLAAGLLVASVWSGVTLGYVTLIAGHVLVSVPFSFLIVRAAASALDPRLDEAAADLGAHRGQIFLRVTLPLLAPAILSGLLLAAVISFDNFIISSFVSGVGTTPLPIHIYGLLRQGLTPKINALGTLLIVVNVAAVLLVMGRYLTTVRR